MLENITLNESNVTASIDAYIHHCLFGYNGVFKCGQQLKCEIINNNLLKIYDGLFINQGRFYRIAPGSYEEIKLENGVVAVSPTTTQSATKRYDLIVSHFETDGVNEKHEIKVISGEGETVPQYTDSDTFNGGTVSEMPLYLVEIDGISIKSVKSQFDIIPNLQELIDKMVMYKE